MSHVVSIKTELRDPTAVSAACRRLALPPPLLGTAELFSGQVTGVIVRLTAWTYPVVIDTTTGQVHYDNYNGAWGDQAHPQVARPCIQACHRLVGPSLLLGLFGGHGRHDGDFDRLHL